MSKESGLKKLADKVLHPGHAEKPAPEAKKPAVEKQDQAETGGSSAEHQRKPRPRSSGSRDAAEDFKQHPKFSKFKGRD